jgi:hypothetical protein
MRLHRASAHSALSGVQLRGPLPAEDQPVVIGITHDAIETGEIVKCLRPDEDTCNKINIKRVGDRFWTI